LATKTPPHVNKAFDEETRKKAYEFINAGKEFDGGFWKNRTLTSKKFGYEDWRAVPETIRACINQIGRAASTRGKKVKRETAKTPTLAQTSLVVPVATNTVFIPEHLLENIYEGEMKIPRDTSVEQIRTIRIYITERAGFDPKKILLGIESRMEKSHAKHVR
jgi:hypothetical protein